MNTIQREALEQALNDIYGTKLCAMNSMSSRFEMIRLLDKATSKLKEALAQPATTEPSSVVDQQPVWFHKHWGEQDDIFYSPTDNIPVGSTPLYTHPVNLNCKSAQARLATLWGYEKVLK